MSRRITSERDMATRVPTNRARTERGEAERPFARARATLYSPGRDDAKPGPKTSREGQADRARRMEGRVQVDLGNTTRDTAPFAVDRFAHRDRNDPAPRALLNNRQGRHATNPSSQG